MVLGAGGGVGIHMIQMARYFGADVTAVDIAAEKLNARTKYGAPQTIDASEQDIADAAESEYDAAIYFTGDADTLDDVPSLLTHLGLVHLTTFHSNSRSSPKLPARKRCLTCSTASL